jgi:urease beta subunit
VDGTLEEVDLQDFSVDKTGIFAGSAERFQPADRTRLQVSPIKGTKTIFWRLLRNKTVVKNNDSIVESIG